MFDPTFSLGVLGSWGISLAATTGQDGCNTFCHPKNFGTLSFGGGSSMGGALGMVAAARALGLSFFFLLQECHPLKDLLISE